MKCPKCGYLGFESVDRCRNCGYDFSLTVTSGHLELPLRVPSAEPEGPQSLGDLSRLDAALPPEPLGPYGGGTPGIPHAANGAPAPGSTSTDLPLFGAAIPDDVPLITRPSPPRPPLAVRRATPEVPRLRNTSARGATLDLGLDQPLDDEGSGVATESTEAFARHAGDDAEEDAAIGARFAAFLTDAMILAAVDAAVVYFTMQICGIGLQDLGILPRAPLFAFLLVQNGGYLVAFTAGGQTLGKMAAGIKVVPAEPRSSLDLGRAFVRELVWLALAAPAGLGLLTVLSRDHRGVHDRFAGTRVVRA
jgi:uncharacterized RDD family membrane protein YckC